MDSHLIPFLSSSLPTSIVRCRQTTEDTQLREDFIQSLSANMLHRDLSFICNPKLTKPCILTGMPTHPTGKSTFMLPFSPPPAHLPPPPFYCTQGSQDHVTLSWAGMALALLKGDASLLPRLKVDGVSTSFLKKTGAAREKPGILTEHLPLLSQTKKRAIHKPN